MPVYFDGHGQWNPRTSMTESGGPEKDDSVLIIGGLYVPF